MGKKLIFVIAFLLLIPLVQGLSIGEGVIFNTSISNSGLFTGIQIEASVINLTSNYILITNCIYNEESGNATFNLTTPINWSSTNSFINTTEFPWISFSNFSQKNISSNLTHTVNATVTFHAIINCSNISTMLYNSTTLTYSENYTSGEWTCSVTDLTLDIEGIEPGFFNVLKISYDIYIIIVIFPNLIVVLLIISWAIVIVAHIYDNEIMGMFGGLLLGICGIFILINGLVGNQTFLTDAMGAVSVGFGFFSLIYFSLKLMHGG